MYDVLRAGSVHRGSSMEARVPFGDLDFVEYVMSSISLSPAAWSPAWARASRRPRWAGC